MLVVSSPLRRCCEAWLELVQNRERVASTWVIELKLERDQSTEEKQAATTRLVQELKGTLCCLLVSSCLSGSGWVDASFVSSLGNGQSNSTVDHITATCSRTLTFASLGDDRHGEYDLLRCRVTHA